MVLPVREISVHRDILPGPAWSLNEIFDGQYGHDRTHIKKKRVRALDDDCCKGPDTVLRSMRTALVTSIMPVPGSL